MRWGIAPTKLYQTYQRFVDDGTSLELRALTVGESYWVAIESFNEHGVSVIELGKAALHVAPWEMDYREYE